MRGFPPHVLSSAISCSPAAPSAPPHLSAYSRMFARKKALQCPPRFGARIVCKTRISRAPSASRRTPRLSAYSRMFACERGSAARIRKKQNRAPIHAYKGAVCAVPLYFGNTSLVASDNGGLPRALPRPQTSRMHLPSVCCKGLSAQRPSLCGSFRTYSSPLSAKIWIWIAISLFYTARDCAVKRFHAATADCRSHIRSGTHRASQD